MPGNTLYQLGSPGLIRNDGALKAALRPFTPCQVAVAGCQGTVLAAESGLPVVACLCLHPAIGLSSVAAVPGDGICLILLENLSFRE